MYCFEKDFYEVAITGGIGLCGIASQIPCIILNGYEPMNGSIMSMGFGTALGAGMRLPLRYKKWKIFHDVMKKEEFKEEKKLYLEYVKDIAEFLKSIGASSDLTGAFLFKMILDSGMLSEDKVEYVTYKKDLYDHFTDIMGARVTTGTFCCRHIASLVTDVINEMGGVACDVAVHRCKTDEEKGLYANHLITGLEQDNKSVLFDPSCPSYLLPIGSLIEFRTQKGKIVSKSFDEEHYYEEKISEHDFEKINRTNIKRLKSLEPLELDEEMLGNYLEAFSIFLRSCDEIFEFRDRELPKIKKLSRLNKIVTPHSEKEKSNEE